MRKLTLILTAVLAAAVLTGCALFAANPEPGIELIDPAEGVQASTSEPLQTGVGSCVLSGTEPTPASTDTVCENRFGCSCDPCTCGICDCLGDLAAVGYNALTVRIPYEFRSGVVMAPVTVIDSAAALTDYVAALGTTTDLDNAELQTALALYQGENSAFFENFYLMIARLDENSGSIRHEPIEILCGPDGIATLWVRRLIPEAGTCDMASWVLFAEVCRDDLAPDAITGCRIAFESAEMTQPDHPGHTGCEG